MQFNKQKSLINLTVFIDVIGIGIIIPVLPFYVGSFNSSPLVMTLLFTVFSLCSFFSAPFLGKWSDKIGRRPVLIISILSTALGWFLFAGAKNLIWLFLGRTIDGLAAGNFSTAQSYLADISKDEKERTQNLGSLGAIFGIGFIIGPMLGGLLSSISNRFPFWVVGFLALINVLLVFLFLPESLKQKSRQEKISFNPFKPLLTALNNKNLVKIFIIWLLFNFSALGMQSIFSLYINKAYGLGASAAGLFMAMIGIIMAVNQMFGLKHLWLKKFQEPNLLFWSLLALGSGFILMSSELFALFVVGLVATTFGQSILRVIMTSEVMGKSEPHQRGETTGILSSLASVAAIFSPIIAGWFFKFNIDLPFIISSVYALLAFVLVYIERKKLKNKHLPEDVVVNILN